jgi:hypothetical protein
MDFIALDRGTTMCRVSLAAAHTRALLVSGGLQVANDSLGTSVVADADRAAKGITKQLSGFFVEQGWTR